MLSDPIIHELLDYQRNEITEHHIYLRLARLRHSAQNRAVLERIAADELRHYGQLRALTGRDVPPDRGRVRRFAWIGRVLGFTFAAKLMERDEAGAQVAYAALPETVEHVRAMMRDEGEHEDALLALLDEERLRYIGSIVLGLNDALVELTGALAGFTLALRNTRLIALTGCITGLAAALSMAASEYLSTQTEEKGQHPLKAALYTGAAYVMTVVLLITPYLTLQSYYAALGCTLLAAVAIIASFTYYLSVARDQPFGRRFAQMAGLSLGVAALSFLVGFALRAVLGVDV